MPTTSIVRSTNVQGAPAHLATPGLMFFDLTLPAKSPHRQRATDQQQAQQTHQRHWTSGLRELGRSRARGEPLPEPRPDAAAGFEPDAGAVTQTRGFEPDAVAAAGFDAVAGAAAAAAAGAADSCPRLSTSVVISSFGSSTIFSADTVMPCLKSKTVAGWPLTSELVVVLHGVLLVRAVRVREDDGRCRTRTTPWPSSPLSS